ncbi:hypothetical protein Tco_0222426 [Tanacetum coccineum]
MASMNTRLNIEKLDGNIVQKHGGSKQVGFKQLGPSVETGVHGVLDEKHVWLKVELQGAQGYHEAEVFQEKEYQTGWKIKTGYVLDSCNERSTQQCMKSVVVKHLGVAGIQQQNGGYNRSTYLANRSPSSAFRFKKPIDMLGFFGWLASIKQGMLEPVKVKCIFLGYHKSIVGNKLWRLDDVTSKVVLYRIMGFNESEEYKKTFIGSGVSTGSIQVLHGFEFEVEPLRDHTFEVEPQENVDQGAGLQEVQTQDLMDYQLARDRDQQSACELFGYREDSNEAAFAVAVVKKIYAHESLTFNNTISCEVISKCKAGLKDDMDTRSDVYVLSNGCRKSSDDSHDYYWEDQSGNTLRVSQSRIYNEKLVQTLLKGQSTLSLEDSLSGDCDVEKNGYGLMIRGCTGSLKANLQYLEAMSTTEAGYMKFTEAWKKEIWLKGLLTESEYDLRLVAGIPTGAFVKGYSRSEVPAQIKVVAYRY